MRGKFPMRGANKTPRAIRRRPHLGVRYALEKYQGNHARSAGQKNTSMGITMTIPSRST